MRGAEPYIAHIEFLSGRDTGLPGRAFWYNAVLEQQYKLPVWTVFVLLRPEADGPELTGVYEKSFPGRGVRLTFHHDVIRIWQEPPEKLLTAGLSLLPLAPVSNVAPEQLEAVVTKVAERLKHEADPELMKTLWTATAVLMGLRYESEQVKAMIEGVRNMIFGIRGIEESSVYQDILAKGMAEGKAEGKAKGAVEEARNALLLPGPQEAGRARSAGALPDREPGRSRSTQSSARGRSGRGELG